MTTPLTVDDFSGGITDNAVDNGMNKCGDADNFVFTISKKLEGRGGSVVFDLVHPQAPVGLNRISDISLHENSYLFYGNKNVYAYATTVYTELKGPSANDAFSSGDYEGFFSHSTWRDTTYIAYDDVTNGVYQRPVKVYKDGSGVLQLRTAGLPALASGITLAGTAGAIQYTYLLGYKYSYYVNDILHLNVGPLTRLPFASSSAADLTPVTIQSIPVLANGVIDNYDLLDTTGISIVIYRSQSNGTTTNLLVEIPSWTPSTAYSIDDYVLKNGVLYVCTTGNSDATWTVGNWSITTSYIDSATDASIAFNVSPYTEGGVVDNDPPPKCKYVHVANNIGWFLSCVDSDDTTILENRLRQSVVNDMDSCPASAYIDFEQAGRGISSYLDRVVVFCTDAVYRVDGAYDEIGGGQLTMQRIHDSAGCISARSIVQVQEGIVWAGNNGFYFTDGFSVIRISTEISSRYFNFTQTEQQRSRIYGCVDAFNKIIYWSVQNEVGSINDCDMHYIYDIDFKAFTTASNGDNYAPTACIAVDGKLLRGDRRGYVFQHGEEYLSDPKVNNTTSANSWDLAPIIYNYVSMATSFDSLMFRKFVPRITVELLSKSNLSLQIISNNDLSAKKLNLKPIRYRNSLIWGDPLMVWGDPTLLWDGGSLIEGQRRFPAKSLRCSYKQVEFTNAQVVITTSDDRGNGTVTTYPASVTLDSATTTWPENCVGQFISFPADEYATKYLITRRTDTELLIANTTLNWETGLGYVGVDLKYQTYDKVAYTGNVYECITANSDIVFDPAKWELQYVALTAGSQEWQISGIPVDERVSILSYTLHYNMLGKTQQVFTKAGTGAVDA